MFAFFNKERTDFETAMDFLQSSRVLLNTAMEAQRHIDCFADLDYASLLEVALVINESAAFMNQNLPNARTLFTEWEKRLLQQDLQRYRKLARMIRTIRGNFELAADNALSINHWVERNAMMKSVMHS